MSVDIPFIWSHWSRVKVEHNYLVEVQIGNRVEKRREPRIFNEYYHIKSGERYRDEEKVIIAFKNFFLCFYNPIVMLGKISWNLCQIPFDIIYVIYLTMVDIKDDIKTCRIKNIAKKIFDGVSEIREDLIEDIQNIVMTPFYALAFEFCTILGMLFPLDARRFVSKIERKWNHDIKPTRNNYYDPDIQNILDIFKERVEPVVLYQAVCFQSLGKLSDINISKC